MNCLRRRLLGAKCWRCCPRLRCWGKAPSPRPPVCDTIDTHHHIYPPKYVGANLDRLLVDTSTLPAAAYTSWTLEFALDQMEKARRRNRTGFDDQPRRLVRRR